MNEWNMKNDAYPRISSASHDTVTLLILTTMITVQIPRRRIIAALVTIM